MKTVFKCTHNIAPSYLRDLFKVRNERMTTRSKKYLIQPDSYILFVYILYIHT